MTVTLATPPSGPNEQIDSIDVSLWCDGVDPVLGVPRPPQGNPETFSINVSTSQGPEPKNTIGLLEKQGLPAGNCYFEFAAWSNTGNTECTGDLQVQINTNQTTQSEVVLACIHSPRFGGVRTDGTFNQCAEYRQILVTPTTQAIGNLVDVATEVYDPDGDPVTVAVQAVGACGNVQTIGSDTAASCETVTGCETVVNTVECTDVGPCEIIVAVSDDGYDSCTGLLPDGSNNNAARKTIAVDCNAAQGLCAGVTCPDTGNDCTVGVCDPATGECEETDVRNGTACDGGAGICSDGSCIVDPCMPLQASQPEVLDPTIETCIYDTGGDLNPADNSGFWVGGIEPAPEGGAVFVTAHNTPPGGSSSEMVLIRSAGFGTATVDTSVGVLPHDQTTRGVDLRHRDGTYWFASTDVGSGFGGVYGATPGVPGFRTFAAGSGIPRWFTSGLTFNASGTEARVTSDLGLGHHIIQAGASTSSLFVDQSPPPVGYNAGSDDHTISLDGRLIIATDLEERLYDATGGPGAVTQLFDFRTIPGFSEPGVGNRIETDPVTGDFFAAWGNGGTTLYRVSADGSSGSIVARNFPAEGIRDLSFGPSSDGDGSSLFVLAISSFGINAEGTIYEFRFPTGELCEGVTCPDAGECVTNFCDPADGVCKPRNDGINTGCDLGGGPATGVCDGQGACVECNIDAQCGAGEFCVGNVCQGEAPFCQYVQDFEALDPGDPDALANDGWLYFGSVFDGDGTFKFQFGPVPAPTTLGQVSAIASGEGGPDQGENQLVVFSNYDCCDIPNQGHFNGTDRVFTGVFQQIDSIPATDIGRTFTFQFDAKRGNIEGATTAQAFIRTLDPDADFAVTSNVELDVTDLPEDWGTYSITLTLSDPDLEGQILQFGFQNTASNFEGSGIFYDNITFGPQDCAGECVVDADCPDDGNECTVAVCNEGLCGSVNLPDGTACNNSAGACNAGVCEPTGPIFCEYEQDFEALDPANPDALANDEWLYFGSVFDGTGVFKFGFGPFPAPTTSGQISAIATGEGGPDQGNNQLVVFSNYDCCTEAGPEGHFNGTDRVNTLVFQDINPILATDIGRTFTFTFDAKRGNIGGNTTAEAYIQTLDPDLGFAITNRVALDTTNLPVDWDTYSLTFDASDPALEGQILSFGFITTASNFDPAGNFYDNISFCAPGGGGGPGIERRPLPDIYFTGNATNYGPYRGDGPGTGDVPSDADILEDLQLMQTAGYNLIRLFGGDAISEKILQIAEANFPELQFQQGLFLEGLPPGPAQDNCDSELNDNQVATAIRLANTYPNVATVSVGNETSFFSAFMPLECLEGYIRETRNNVTQPVTADDDYTFYANFFGRAPDGVLREIDFVAIHMYPFTNYRFWDWQQLGVPAGPLRAEAMMNESLAVAQANYQAVYDYQYRDPTGATVTIGETIPIVVGETGWKWRQTNSSQEIETYAGNPVNAKWYDDLMRGWERTPGGPPTIFIFVAFDEAWKTTDDGWGFWDEFRQPNYALCGTPAGAACNVPVYQGAGFYPF
jgi:exo-beta-1,3-glucanase (GH17 family)